MPRAKKHPLAAKPPAPAAPPAAEPAAIPPRETRRLWLAIALGAAALWWLFLIVTAAMTANPVLLNQAQIRDAAYVAVVRVEDAAAGQVTVERELRHGDILGRIAIFNLQEADCRHFTRQSIEPGQRYVMPLSVDEEGRYHIAAGRLRGTSLTPRFIYPATADAIEQARLILEGR